MSDQQEQRGAAVYRFSTFQELVDRVPADRIRDCMEELGTILGTAKASTEIANRMVVEILKQAGRSIADTGSQVIKLPEEFEWVDDGKRELEATLTDSAGNRMFTVKSHE